MLIRTDFCVHHIFGLGKIKICQTCQINAFAVRCLRLTRQSLDPFPSSLVFLSSLLTQNVTIHDLPSALIIVVRPLALALRRRRMTKSHLRICVHRRAKEAVVCQRRQGHRGRCRARSRSVAALLGRRRRGSCSLLIVKGIALSRLDEAWDLLLLRPATRLRVLWVLLGLIMTTLLLHLRLLTALNLGQLWAVLHVASVDLLHHLVKLLPSILLLLELL